MEKLTKRETEVLEKMAQGLKNKEIAEALYVSVGTTKNHICNIYQKLEVHNAREAIAYYYQNKIKEIINDSKTSSKESLKHRLKNLLSA